MSRTAKVAMGLLLVACGSDGNDPTAGDPTRCAGRASLSGGVDRSVDVVACGSAGATMTLAERLSEGPAIRFELGRLLEPTEVGTIPVVKTTLTVTSTSGKESWEAGAGVCRLELASRAKDDNIGLAYGTGTASCSAPLQPSAGNPKAPVTLIEVSFTALVPSNR